MFQADGACCGKGKDGDVEFSVFSLVACFVVDKKARNWYNKCIMSSLHFCADLTRTMAFFVFGKGVLGL